MANLNGHETGNGGNSQGAPTVFSWRGYEKPAGSETVARYQKDIAGTRETQCVSTGRRICDNNPMNGKLLQKTHWGSDKPIVVRKQGNACGAKGLTGKGNISKTNCQRLWVEDTYSRQRRVVPSHIGCVEPFLKSRMRENLKSGSVRGLIVSPMDCKFQRRWL